MKTTRIVAALLVSAFALPVFAQTGTPEIARSQRNQEARIDQGVRSGQLTGQEGRNLQRQQDQIRAAKRSARADGVVTREERRNIKRQQMRANRAIYRKKHNGRTA